MVCCLLAEANTRPRPVEPNVLHVLLFLVLKPAYQYNSNPKSMDTFTTYYRQQAAAQRSIASAQRLYLFMLHIMPLMSSNNGSCVGCIDSCILMQVRTCTHQTVQLAMFHKVRYRAIKALCSRTIVDLRILVNYRSLMKPCWPR